MGFETELNDFSDKVPGNSVVKVWKDGQLVAKTFTRIGNNNRVLYGGGGYHAQFGIADGSDSMEVKFKGVDIAPAYQIKLTDTQHSFPFSYASGECELNGQNKAEGPASCESTISPTDPTTTVATTTPAVDPVTTATTTSVTDHAKTTATTTIATESATTAKPSCHQEQTPTDAIADIANKFTAEVDTRHLGRRLKRILMFGPRDNVHKFSKGQYKKVVKQLERFLDRMGVASFRQDFSYGTRKRDFRRTFDLNSATPKSALDKGCNPANNNSCNLCALIPGKSSNVVVAGAHLDTVWQSPGANDNGSSVVALLEAIRIFKKSGLKPNNPVLFCFWGSEEQSPRNYDSRRTSSGLAFGSHYFLHNEGYKDVTGNLTAQDPCHQQADPFRIECYLNLEMVGTRADHKWDVHPEFLTISDPEKAISGTSPKGTGQLTELYVDYLKDRGLSYYRDEPSPGVTDVGAFYKNNIPAVTVTTGKDAFYFHRPGDKFDAIDLDVISNATQAVVHTLATLSFGEGLNITRT
ncbi:M28 family metallopeptidase [Salinisphaera sp. G21_0]|uniref:M28 family metallopeptidase n=1 Tax=Salinisphaera sp. G21_0 TaxID=2821094 RepID=UPI001ADB2142|nr:M28 family metallopeptidase [Salinisphaera sp. G21_0]MBO9480736.1 Zn-dependent exopeptidase M28 [Salinisphaera sp. G21_0]